MRASSRGVTERFIAASGCGTLVTLLTMCPGCAVGRYFRDRALDLTDIVDVKYGALGAGMGAKVEASTYSGAGLGAGGGYHTGETYGRWHHDHGRIPVIFHLGILGLEGESGPCPSGEGTFLLVNVLEDDPPPIDRARLGGEVWLPLVRFGAYVNFGQFGDFFAGIAGFDPAGDDGAPKWARMPVWNDGKPPPREIVKEIDASESPERP
jgi:hypothetical protein